MLDGLTGGIGCWYYINITTSRLVEIKTLYSMLHLLFQTKTNNIKMSFAEKQVECENVTEFFCGGFHHSCCFNTSWI